MFKSYFACLRFRTTILLSNNTALRFRNHFALRTVHHLTNCTNITQKPITLYPGLLGYIRGAAARCCQTATALPPTGPSSWTQTDPAGDAPSGKNLRLPHSSIAKKLRAGSESCITGRKDGEATTGGGEVTHAKCSHKPSAGA